MPPTVQQPVGSADGARVDPGCPFAPGSHHPERSIESPRLDDLADAEIVGDLRRELEREASMERCRAEQAESVAPGPKKKAKVRAPKKVRGERPGLYVLPFGKHKGRTLATVWGCDRQYLLWLDDQPWVRPEMRENLWAFLEKAMAKAARRGTL